MKRLLEYLTQLLSLNLVNSDIKYFVLATKKYNQEIMKIYKKG